jgi:iron complex outermembrane receptor protein
MFLKKHDYLYKISITMKLKFIKWKVFLFFLTGMFTMSNVNAQTSQITINGHVKDATGEPVIGASVLVAGTSTGAITNVDGNFQLTAAPDGKLSVSFIGYLSQDVNINGQQSIVITLEEHSQLLSEVVVIGYGTVKKNDATGSVIAMKPDEMNKGLVTNAQDMIVGKIAGVSVISDGGTPGSSAQIRIRGGSSLSASNDPLIVIDGLPMDNEGVQGLANPLSMVNPNDIESFTVLKDASATAIYGSRASNGVIIITTKKGQKGSRPRLTYDGNVSVSRIKRTVDVLSGDEFRSYANTLYAGREDVLGNLGAANTDWQDEIYRTGVNTDHNVTMSGGLKNMPYRVSVGYTNQNGILKTSGFERYTASASAAPSFLDNHLNFNLNAKLMHAKTRYADAGAVGAAVAMDPTKPVKTSQSPYGDYFGGYYQWDIDATSFNDPSWTRTANSLATKNPVSTLDLKNDRSKSNSFIGNAEVDYKFHFLSGLRWHANLGGDFSSGSQTTDIDKLSGTNNYYGHYGYKEQDKYNMAFSTYFQFNKEFKNQNLDMMAGYEWQHFHRKGYETRYGTTPASNPATAGAKVNTYDNKWKTESFLVSFFGRVNYSILNRYLITATLRNDGSSRFHKDHRWGLFPSAALAWKIKEEGFLKDVDVLSELKLRLGYGVTGQQNINQGDYPYIPVYNINIDGAYYLIGNEYYNLYRPDAYNKDLKWEETTTYNAGLDVSFLNRRISASLDYYFRETKDLINVVDVPAGTNFSNRVISNIGSLENRGFEFLFNAKPVVTKDFTWDSGFNFTTNSNEITKLTTGSGEGYYIAVGDISTGTGNKAQAHIVGKPANSFYVYQQVYDGNGNPIENLFVDRNGDGIINDNDKYVYKKPSAGVLMGITSKFLYKRFDLSFSLRASLNNYVYNDVLARNANAGVSGVWSTSGFFSNRPVDAVNLGFNGIGDYHLSDYFVRNASFLKCDNISLGYSFNNLFDTIGGRVYATVQNVFAITKYSGLDPELKDGIDKELYPRPFVGILGVSLNF